MLCTLGNDNVKRIAIAAARFGDEPEIIGKTRAPVATKTERSQSLISKQLHTVHGLEMYVQRLSFRAMSMNDVNVTRGSQDS